MPIITQSFGFFITGKEMIRMVGEPRRNIGAGWNGSRLVMELSILLLGFTRAFRAPAFFMPTVMGRELQV
jgi:hypothetical protein